MFGLFANYSETAQATILHTSLLHTIGEAGRQGGAYEFILEVQPPTGESFRVATRINISATIRTPQTGAVITVKYNPKNRNIKLEFKGDPRYDLTIPSNTIPQEQNQERASLPSSIPTTPVPSASPIPAPINEQMMRDKPSEK